MGHNDPETKADGVFVPKFDSLFADMIGNKWCALKTTHLKWTELKTQGFRVWGSNSF